MGLLSLSSAACCLEHFLEPRLTSTVGSSRVLNIHCALSALNMHRLRVDGAIRALQHALSLDNPLYFTFPLDTTQRSTSIQQPNATKSQATRILHCIQQHFLTQV